jgi:hypothetical protein
VAAFVLDSRFRDGGDVSLRSGRLLPNQEDSRHSLLFEAESTPGP